jgi:DNA-binding NtrC family response regulator
MQQAMSIDPVSSEVSDRPPVAESQRQHPADGCVSSSACDPGGSILLGESVAVRRLRSQIQRIAPHFRTALIRGEAGSGKEFVARALHALSASGDGPFLVTRASRLADLIANDESTHHSYSQAGASLLESAQGGTLYLKGVNELSFGQQVMLFRFLCACEERRSAVSPTARSGYDGPERRRVEPRSLRCRVLAASDRDLRTLSAIGQFRQDLYARLSAVEIFVPPLRQRMEDIPALAGWLLHRLAEATSESPKRLDEATLAQLQERAWPDNHRELEQVLAQAAAIAEGAIIEPRHLLALVEPGFANVAAPTAVKMERLHDVMLHHVLDVLARCSGNKLRAAEALGISRSTLYRMLGSSSGSTSSVSEL